MPRWIRRFLGIGMALLAVAGGVEWFNTRETAEVAILRKKFPYVSLVDRLSYEARHQEQAGEHEPILLKPALDRLEAAENFFWLGSTARMESLEKLHSREANHFINSPGNGRARFGRKPSPSWLDYETPDPIPLTADVADSAGEPEDSAVNLPEQALREESDGAWTPSIKLLGDFHWQNDDVFVDPWRLGHVKDRDHVAGFVSHGFSSLPVLTHPKNKSPWSETEKKWVDTHPARWTIARLELVSLLKFEKPAVYVSDHLPEMSELADAKTRPLTQFEEQALESLRSGEYLVATAGTNQIQMLGSLRATKDCLKCHSAQRGALLGAFSYRLRREPTIPVKPSVKPPST